MDHRLNIEASRKKKKAQNTQKLGTIQVYIYQRMERQSIPAHGILLGNKKDLITNMQQ